ncbi:hypothetical protein AURDEDRAFT_110460, partial [Auricularia subglabra TFB-10046 SS5]
MGNEQSSPARNSRSYSRSTKSVACTPSPSPSPSRRASPTRRPGRAARDPFADEPPPPYTKASPTEKYLSPDSAAFLSAPSPSTSDLRRSSSTSGSPRTPLAASSQSNAHRRHQSMVDPRLHSSAVPGASRVDLRSIEQDLRVLQEALASSRSPSRSPSPRPGLFISRTPSPLPLGSNNPYMPRTTHTITLTVPRLSPSRAPASGEDPLILLKRYDTQVIIDDSESMLGDHWYEACDALAKLVDAASKYEISGIRLHFLNSTHTCLVKCATDVRKAFQTVTPQIRSASPVGEKLEQLLLEYMASLEASKAQGSGGEPPKPVNYIVLTDGAPSDDPESVIVATARRLDSQHFPLGQIGIQFVQIGNDPEATAALRELDDELAKTHGVRDMVDTTPYAGGVLTAEILAKILLGGVNRRVDKRSL